MILFRSIFLCFRIWLLFALLNGIAWVLYFVTDANSLEHIGEALLVCIGGTLLLSVPSMVIIWIVILANRNSVFLFRRLLSTALLLAGLLLILLLVMPFSPKKDCFFLSLCAAITSISTLMIHHRAIQSYNENYINHA